MNDLLTQVGYRQNYHNGVWYPTLKDRAGHYIEMPLRIRIVLWLANWSDAPGGGLRPPRLTYEMEDSV